MVNSVIINSLFCPWISLLLISVVANFWNTQPVIFRYLTQFPLKTKTQVVIQFLIGCFDGPQQFYY